MKQKSPRPDPASGDKTDQNIITASAKTHDVQSGAESDAYQDLNDFIIDDDVQIYPKPQRGASAGRVDADQIQHQPDQTEERPSHVDSDDNTEMVDPGDLEQRKEVSTAENNTPDPTSDEQDTDDPKMPDSDDSGDSLVEGPTTLVSTETARATSSTPNVEGNGEEPRSSSGSPEYSPGEIVALIDTEDHSQHDEDPKDEEPAEEDSEVPFFPGTKGLSSDVDTDDQNGARGLMVKNAPQASDYFPMARLPSPWAQLFCREKMRNHLVCYFASHAKGRWEMVYEFFRGKNMDELLLATREALVGFSGHKLMLRGWSDESSAALMQLATWYVHWLICKIPRDKGMKKKYLFQAIDTLQGEHSTEFQDFYNHLSEIAANYASLKDVVVPQKVPVRRPPFAFRSKTADSSSAPAFNKESSKIKTTSKSKKRQSESQEAAQWSSSGMQRKLEAEERAKQFRQNLNKVSDDSVVYINPGASGKGLIAINKHISKSKSSYGESTTVSWLYPMAPSLSGCLHSTH